MKRIFSWLLLAIALPLFYTATVATAAPIPPTPECSKALRAELAAHERRIFDGVTDREEHRSERRMIDALVAAGCVSARVPTEDPLPPRPNTPECAVASTAAEDFWKPGTTALNVAYKALRTKVYEPRKRLFAEYRRDLRELTRQRAGGRAFKRLMRQRDRAAGRLERIELRISKRTMTAIGPRSHATYLIVYELMATRCIGVNTIGLLFANAFESGDKWTPSGPLPPAARAFKRNLPLIFTSMLHVTMLALMEGSGEKIAEMSAVPAEPLKATGRDRALDPPGLPGL